MKSSSKLNDIGILNKICEAFTLLTMSIRTNINPSDYDQMIAEYTDILENFGNKSLTDSRVLEIGFGARPFRLFWLLNMEVDIWGVDLDRPLLSPTISDFQKIWRTNGTERAAKSFVRHLISDRRHLNQIRKALKNRNNLNYTSLPGERLIVADAASQEFWNNIGKFDFIYSEDVFEHIPSVNLETLVELMAEALRPNGIAVIRPMIYTGICGGHQLEWYPHTVSKTFKRRIEPWEHLRQNRHPANTYLNKLSLSEYVDLFSKSFNIVETKVMNPDLGRQFINDDIRRELYRYDESELFSNSVRFTLKPL